VVQQALFLVQHGVPFDVAFALEPHEALAFAVVIGQNLGREWSWDSLSWQSNE